MADILIRGIEMPKTCVQCDLKWFEPEKIWNDNGVERIGTWTCRRTGEIIWNTKRGENCPLVPLPEGHGRLIDADAFKADCLAATKEAKPDFIRHEDWIKSCAITMSFCRDIDERPTIVPAEGGLRDEQ